MSIRIRPALVLGALAAVSISGCVTRPPTIAHVHLGHAVTGVHVTPGHKGYLLLAEQRANEALEAAQRGGASTDLGALQAAVAAAVVASDSPTDFGLKEALVLAANHISFAATSADASENVIQFAPEFKADIAAVVGRCEYIGLLGKDVAVSTSLKDATLLAREILKAAQANVRGDDSSGAGLGRVRADYGMVQLRDRVQSMLARENPPYRTVDEWYLFNLVRLPNGRWVFDKLSRGGNVDGYQ